MDSFKAPDLNAPRYRAEAYNMLNKDFFKRFKEAFPKYKHLEEKELRKIVKVFNELVYETVINNRDGVKLPNTIGWLFIGTCISTKKKNIDFGKSKKYGVTVTNKNWDSDGRLAKIFFSNYAPKYKMKNREYWAFEACRNFKRLVSKTYPENWNMYRTIEPNRRIRSLYTKHTYKEHMQKKTEEALKTYNEFDL